MMIKLINSYLNFFTVFFVNMTTLLQLGICTKKIFPKPSAFTITDVSMLVCWIGEFFLPSMFP